MAGFDGTRPIFLQLAEMLEEGIISGAYPEEGQIPSITEFSAALKINPATALKGINLLVDEGLVYKKRGVGMFVATGARDALLHTMACKAAIKGGWKSDLSELRVLVDKVQSGEVQFCPHGRPVKAKLTKYELEKMFKRA